MMINWDQITEAILDIKKKMGAHIELPDDVFDQVKEKSNHIFNPREALDSEQVKVYNEFKDLKAIVEAEIKALKKAKEETEKKVNKVKNLENFFTSSIELKHDLSNKVWRVNEQTGMVEVFDQARAKQEMKEMGLNEILPPNLFGDDSSDD